MENGPTQFFSAKRRAHSRGFVEESEITMKEVFDHVEQVWLLTKTFSDVPQPISKSYPHTLGCYGNTISLQWFSSFFEVC